MIKTNIKEINNIVKPIHVFNKRFLSFTVQQKVLNNIPTPMIKNVKVNKTKNVKTNSEKNNKKNIPTSIKSNTNLEINNKKAELKKIENQLNNKPINEVMEEVVEEEDDEEDDLNTELVQRLANLKIKYKKLDKKSINKNLSKSTSKKNITKKNTQRNKKLSTKSTNIKKKNFSYEQKKVQVKQNKKNNNGNENFVNINQSRSQFEYEDSTNEYQSHWNYVSRPMEEKQIQSLLLNSQTSINIVSGPALCGKTTIIQNVLQNTNIDYVVLETEDFQNEKTLYDAIVSQFSSSIINNEILNSLNQDDPMDNKIFNVLNLIPEQVPIIIDDAYALFTFQNEDGVSFNINPTFFEWLYSSLENNKKINITFVSSNPLIECWIDTNIPKEIINHCQINDLTYEEAEQFYNNYIHDNDLNSIDISFNDIYQITGTRISIIVKFIQEYMKKNEDFIDLDFTLVNQYYQTLGEIMKEEPEQSGLIKRIMAIMVSESNRGYVEEKELEYIFENNHLIEFENGRMNQNQIQQDSSIFWEIIALMIEKQILNRRIEVFYQDQSSKNASSTTTTAPFIQRPVIIPENQCVVYAMNLILLENNIVLQEEME